jgi:hypothetical protein
MRVPAGARTALQCERRGPQRSCRQAQRIVWRGRGRGEFGRLPRRSPSGARRFRPRARPRRNAPGSISGPVEEASASMAPCGWSPRIAWSKTGRGASGWAVGEGRNRRGGPPESRQRPEIFDARGPAQPAALVRGRVEPPKTRYGCRSVRLPHAVVVALRAHLVDVAHRPDAGVPVARRHGARSRQPPVACVEARHPGGRCAAGRLALAAPHVRNRGVCAFRGEARLVRRPRFALAGDISVLAGELAGIAEDPGAPALEQGPADVHRTPVSVRIDGEGVLLIR